MGKMSWFADIVEEVAFGKGCLNEEWVGLVLRIVLGLIMVMVGMLLVMVVYYIKELK